MEENINFDEVEDIDGFDVETFERLLETETNNQTELWESFDSLVSEINETPEEGELYSLGDHVVETVVDSILGPFGLSRALFDDKDGGAVTTQHNANEGIYARKQEEYNRKDYDFTQKQREKILDSRRDDEGNVRGGYTDAKLDEDNIDLDHEFPAHAYHKYAGWMQTPEQRKAFGTDERNLNPQESSMNRSKGDNETSEYANKPNKNNPEETNKEHYGMDGRRIKGCENRSQKAIDEHAPTTKERIIYHSKQIGIQGAKAGFAMAARRAIGVALKMLVEEGWSAIKEGIAKYKQGLIKDVKSFLKFIVDRLDHIRERIANTLKEMCIAAAEGGVAGFASVLITFIINSFITTAKRVVTMIREAVNTIVRVIRALAEKGKTKREKMSTAARILLDGLMGIIGIALLEAVVTFIKTTPLNPIAETVGNIIVAIISGLLGVLIMYLITQIRIHKEKEPRRKELEEKIYGTIIMGNTLAIQSTSSATLQVERSIQILSYVFQETISMGQEWRRLIQEGNRYDQQTDENMEATTVIQTSTTNKLEQLKNNMEQLNKNSHGE